MNKSYQGLNLRARVEDRSPHPSSSASSTWSAYAKIRGKIREARRIGRSAGRDQLARGAHVAPGVEPDRRVHMAVAVGEGQIFAAFHVAACDAVTIGCRQALDLQGD